MSNVDDLIQKVELILEQPPSIRQAMALRQVVTGNNLIALIEAYKAVKLQEAKANYRVTQLTEALGQTKTVVAALEKQARVTLNKLESL